MRLTFFHGYLTSRWPPIEQYFVRGDRSSGVTSQKWSPKIKPSSRLLCIYFPNPTMRNKLTCIGPMFGLVTTRQRATHCFGSVVRQFLHLFTPKKRGRNLLKAKERLECCAMLAQPWLVLTSGRRSFCRRHLEDLAAMHPKPEPWKSMEIPNEPF